MRSPVVGQDTEDEDGWRREVEGLGIEAFKAGKSFKKNNMIKKNILLDSTRYYSITRYHSIVTLLYSLYLSFIWFYVKVSTLSAKVFRFIFYLVAEIN